MNTTSSSMTRKGYGFHPTNEELINHYLRKKMLGYEDQVSAIAEVDICKHEPWDLPMLSKLPLNNHTWYFFGRPDYKHRNSNRANRKTKEGYWKVTGECRIIKNRADNKAIAIKKNLVFYRGRVPKGVKTEWVIHEYHQNFSSSNGKDFTICHLKRKSCGKINNSTIDEGESSHDATSDLKNPVTEFTFSETDQQVSEEFFGPNEEDFNPPDGNLQNTNSFTDNYNVPFGTSDLQDNNTKWMNSSTAYQDVYSIDGSMPAMTEFTFSETDLQVSEEFFGPNEDDFNPPDGNLQNTNSFTDNYNVPTPQFGTSDLQDNTTKWMNSSTAYQDVYSIDGSMPAMTEFTFSETDLQVSEEFFGPKEDDFNPPDGNLQNTNSFTDNYNVPTPQFGTSDLQDNTTKWMNSSTAYQDVYSIDGSMPAMTEFTFSETNLQILEEFFGSNEEDFNPPDAHQSELCMEQGPSDGNLQNTNSFTDNYNVPTPQFGTSDLQDNTTKWMNLSTAYQDVYSIDGSMPALSYDSSPLESFGNLLVDNTGDTEEVNNAWVNSCFEPDFGG